MAFTGSGIGTEIDPFQITTVSQFREMDNYGSSVYFKLMNHLNFSGEAIKYFNISNFISHFDGNSKELQGLTTGIDSVYGFQIQNGCSIKNITARIVSSLSTSSIFSGFLGIDTTTLDNVTIDGIHVITSGTGELHSFSRHTWNANCTINNIVLEGAIYGVFTGTVKNISTHIKVLRVGVTTVDKPNIDHAVTGCIVNNLYGELKWCQTIVPTLQYYYGTVGPIVKVFFDGAKITECYADVKIYVDPYFAHGFMYYAMGIAGTTSEVKDSIFKGYFEVTGGSQGSGDPNYGKSGFVITSNKNIKINRCFADADIVSTLNQDRSLFTVDISTNANNNYYKKSKLTSLRTIDITDRQIGLTDTEVLDESKYTNYDFETIWTMGATGPYLTQNPIHQFETSIRTLVASNPIRVSSTAFSVSLAVAFQNTFGVDIYQGNTLIDTKLNTLLAEITVPYNDALYTIKPFFLDGEVKTYASTITYKHYCNDLNFLVPTNIEVTTKKTLNTIVNSSYVHGSCVYNGFIYGVTRGIDQNGYSHLVIAPEHDISNYISIPIWGNESGSYKPTDSEQVVECGGYLYFIIGGGQVLVQYDPVISDYKIFTLPTNLRTDSAPISTDGQYLYFINSDADKVYKVDHLNYVGSFPKYNTSAVFEVVISATYDSSTQGFYSAGGYLSKYKGICHSVCIDSEYIYIAYTSDVGGTTFGYLTALGVSVHELHKVRKSDMTGAGCIKIPQATDDCAQSSTHLFYGVEIGNYADPATLGFGWSIYSVRKSDLQITALSKLNTLDVPPNTASYGVFILGARLFNISTTGIIYVVDISDVDNWNINEDAGKRLLQIFRLQYQSTNITNPLNELLIGSDRTFYSFHWAAISELTEYQLPIEWLPIISTPTPELNNTTHKLIASITGGKWGIINRGIRYGLTPESLTNTILSSDTTDTFSVDIPSDLFGTYYFQAFATNIEGESNAEILGFSRLNYHWRVKVVSNGKTKTGNDNQVISFKVV